MNENFSDFTLGAASGNAMLVGYDLPSGAGKERRFAIDDVASYIGGELSLAGGTTGQVLTKASNADYDFTWAAGGGGNPFDAVFDQSAVSALGMYLGQSTGNEPQIVFCNGTAAENCWIDFEGNNLKFKTGNASFEPIVIFTDSGLVYISPGLSDGSPVLSLDPAARKAYMNDGVTTAIDWQNLSLTDGFTGTTQAPGDNSTKLATTAYVDVGALPGGASEGMALIYSSGVPVWSWILSDSSLFHSADWENRLLVATNGSTTVLNWATLALADGWTGTTQTPGDNSTKLATTAYVDSYGFLTNPLAVDLDAGAHAINNVAGIIINSGSSLSFDGVGYFLNISGASPLVFDCPDVATYYVFRSQGADLMNLNASIANFSGRVIAPRIETEAASIYDLGAATTISATTALIGLINISTLLTTIDTTIKMTVDSVDYYIPASTTQPS